MSRTVRMGDCDLEPASRLLVVADLHLEKGMGYSDDRLGEQEAVWEQALRVGVDREVDAVLFAGDATEYRAPSSAARAAFQRPLVGLGLPVLAIPGNHDVKHPRYPTALDLMGPNLGGSLLDVSKTPEPLLVGPVSVVTLPWQPLGAIIAAQGRRADDLFDDAAIALLQIAEAKITQARRANPRRPVVVLGHWAIDAATTPAGLPATAFHEPVIPLERLKALDCDAAAFGHVHRPQQWGKVVSPGSPLPLDFGEADCLHGVWILDVKVGGCEWEFVPVSSRPFVTLDFDLTSEPLPYPAGQEAEALAHFGGWLATGLDWNPGAVVRVRYTATEAQARLIDHGEIHRELLAAGAHKVWQITPTIEGGSRARVEHIGALHPFDAIDAWIAAQPSPTDPAVRVRAREVLQAVGA